MNLWLLLFGVALAPIDAPVTGTAVPAPGAVAPDTTGVVLSGQVRMEAYRGGPGLPGALIEVRQGDRLRTAVTDREGRYRLTGLQPGEAALQVRHLAAEPDEMILTLPRGGSVEVDVRLERRIIPIQSIDVRVRRHLARLDPPSAPLTTTDPRHVGVRLRIMESSSGIVESGLARRSPSATPGEDERPPEKALFMRGSTVDSRLVLLDGAPILTPFHLAGLVPSFDSRSLREATIYLGGAPSRFEGGLSYVLDVESEPAHPDQPTFEAALDGLALRGGLNLSHGERGGIAATYRTLHGAQASLTPVSKLPYTFEDLLVRGDLDLGGAGDLRVTLFRNREGVVLDSLPGTNLGTSRTEWGNRALSARWRAGLGSHSLEVVGATTSYDASLPVEWDAPAFASTRADRHRLGLRMTRLWSGLAPGPSGAPGGALRWGTSFERQTVDYLLGPGSDEVGRESVQARLDDAPVGVRGDRAGLFGEVESLISDRIGFQVGGRIDHFGSGAGVRFSPRGALGLDLTDDARLSLSAGRFHQYVPEPGLEETQREDELSNLQWDAAFGVASATHMVMELDQRLTDEFSLGISGFVKRFEESPARGGNRVNASGTDLRINREGERLDAWTGYALSWFWEPGAGGRTSSEFAGRHLLTSGVRVRDGSGLEMGASIEYGAGLPLTQIPITFDGGEAPVNLPSGGRSVERLAEASADNPLDLIIEEDFLRIDVEASWVTHPMVAGRRTELRPYIRVLNAMHRRDALFYYFDAWRSPEIQPLAERPVLPLIGLEWRF